MSEIVSGVVAIVIALVAIGSFLVARRAYLWQRKKDEEGQRREQPPLVKGLSALLHAHELARDEGRGAWDFAVEATELRDLGLYNSDLRLLIHRGYVEHAEAFTRPGYAGRGFQYRGDPGFTVNTCFILTEEGVEYARNLLASREKE